MHCVMLVYRLGEYVVPLEVTWVWPCLSVPKHDPAEMALVSPFSENLQNLDAECRAH